MSTHNSSLILLKRPEPEPSPELIQEALDRWMSTDLSDFAVNLEIARSMWRKFPELVAAPGFPEQLRAAYVAEWDHEPSDDCDVSEEAIAPGHRESLRPHALEVARGWMQKGREENSDANFLGELGIAG